MQNKKIKKTIKTFFNILNENKKYDEVFTRLTNK